MAASQLDQANGVSAGGKRESIAALTGLRAIAAWLVWLRHSDVVPNPPAFLARFSLEGGIGVSVFFVLSGFLIALRYFDSARLDRGWFKDYVTKRFARIYPVYFLITLISLVVYRKPALEWFTSLTLTGGFVSHQLLVVGPAWTLTVEECFYLSAPLLFLAMRRGFVAGFVLPLCLAYGVVLFFALLGVPSDDPWFVARNTFPGRILEFLSGAWAAVLFQRGRLRARSGLWTYGGVAAFFAGMLILMQRQDPGTPAYNSQGVALTMVLGSLVLPWASVMIIIGLSLEVTWISRFLGHPLLVLCGKASYVFYLIHMGFVAGLLAKYLGLVYWHQFFAMNLISIAAFWFYEEPLRNLISGSGRNRRAGLASA